jgi:hypothetical protein
MKNILFARNLVKGKIAETVFAQMLRDTGEFTVLEFGYEKIIPELVQRGAKEGDKELETLRTAPDFAVINKDTNKVHLIEVKYRNLKKKSDTLAIAKRMTKSWNPSYLFLATPAGFYFDEAAEIVKKKGEISPLKHKQIPEDLQKAYLKILNDFEQ